MLRLRTQARLLMLSGWVLPPGFTRETLIQDDGALSVTLTYSGVARSINFGNRGWIAWAAYRRLNSVADSIFIEAERESLRARSFADSVRRAAMRREERRFASEHGESMAARARRRQDPSRN